MKQRTAQLCSCTQCTPCTSTSHAALLHFFPHPNRELWHAHPLNPPQMVGFVQVLSPSQRVKPLHRAQPETKTPGYNNNNILLHLQPTSSGLHHRTQSPNPGLIYLCGVLSYMNDGGGAGTLPQPRSYPTLPTTTPTTQNTEIQIQIQYSEYTPHKSDTHHVRPLPCFQTKTPPSVDPTRVLLKLHSF